MTKSWMWYSGTLWPKYSLSSQNNANEIGNGLSIDPKSKVDIDWQDQNKDGAVSDADTDDHMDSNGDTVGIGDKAHVLQEVALYTNSTITADGMTYHVNLAAFVLNDGTFGVRTMDGGMPKGVYPHNITGIYLGTWDGKEYSGLSVSSFDDRFVCFAAGTPIDTPDGPRAVETLGPGDQVMTLDHGPMPLLWTGQRNVCGSGSMAPVLIGAFSLGNSQPVRVSPQHRVLIGGWRAELHFDQPEVLIAAKHLVGTSGIVSAPCATVTYVHLLLEGHQILRSAGLLSESLLPSAIHEDWFAPSDRAAVLRVCPFPERVRAARLCLAGHEARLLHAA